MPESAQRLLRVAAARVDFLESGRPGAAGVPDIVAASWERSQAAGVNSNQPHSEFSDEIDTASLLVRCARPVLRQLGADAADIPMVIALTDNRARVVQRIDTSPAVGRLLDRVDFAPGFSYSEAMMGTNGVGTVLEAGQAISVVGPEHFAENLQAFACTGAPIIDPITRRVEGVLDISSLSQGWSPLMHTLVKSAAKDISRNLLMDRSLSQQAIFETYLRVDAKSSRQAVFAFGESVFMANATAQALFSAEEQRTLREHATFMIGTRERASDTLELPGGRVVQIRGTRILAGPDVAGMVLIAEIVQAHRTGSPGDFTEQVLPPVAVATRSTSMLVDSLNRPHDAIAAGSSPAWVRSCDQLRVAMTDQVPAVVIGETGSGKFTLVAEIFHEIHPHARSVAIDAAQLGENGDPADIELMMAAETEPTLYIIRDIAQASTDGVQLLEEFFSRIDAADGPSAYAATLSDASLDSDLPFHTLLAHFDVAVKVPPLRLRGDDLPQVVAALLREIAPDRRVRLSPAALRLVSRYTWPRNVTQLREALVHAIRRRPVGELQDEDLPGYCQSASKHALTPLESAERDAIVAALTEHGGNRVAAAAHLGMSRSSLYRKLHTYGITA